MSLCMGLCRAPVHVVMYNRSVWTLSQPFGWSGLGQYMKMMLCVATLFAVDSHLALQHVLEFVESLSPG